MANITLPSNPVNGQKVVIGTRLFQYDSTAGRWISRQFNSLGSTSINIPNLAPVISVVPTSIELSTSGANVFLNYTVSDVDSSLLKVSHTVYGITNSSFATVTHHKANNTLQVQAGTEAFTNGNIVLTVSDGRNNASANVAVSASYLPQLIYGRAGNSTTLQDYVGAETSAKNAGAYSSPTVYNYSYNLIARTADSHYQFTGLPPLDFSGASLNRIVLAIKFSSVSHYENGFSMTDNNGQKIGLVGYTNTNLSPPRSLELVSVFGNSDGKFHDSFEFQSKGDLILTPMTTNPGAAGVGWRCKQPGASKTPFDVLVTDAGFSFSYHAYSNTLNSVQMFSRDATTSSFTSSMTNLTVATDSFESTFIGLGVYDNSYDVDDCLYALEQELYNPTYLAEN